MEAPGGPGRDPRWTGGAKDAVGTARSAASHLWYTITRGAVSEVYWPTIDRPQLRDLQFLVSDGATFVHQETRDLESTIEPLAPHALGYRVVGTPPDERYRLVKEVITDPDQSALLLRVTLETARPQEELRLYLLCAPHLEVGGWGNSGEIMPTRGNPVFLANKGTTCLALGASVPLVHPSVGFVGVNDGWQDLADNLALDWSFDRATDGNIAFVAKIGATPGEPFTVAVTFSESRAGALAVLGQVLGRDYGSLRERFIGQWSDACSEPPSMHAAAGDGGRLAHLSQSLLLAHEDKLYRGALIASLSIPWGDARGDEDLGGYHLVWTRDMVNSATGLLAAGHTETALRALIYLSVTQRPDGGFYQNFWINGEPYWQGIQLDEVAFPILLARRLHRLRALEQFDPYPMVRAAAAFLVRNGPATRQERWEEASGYSPSTLASSIAALTCAAAFVRERNDPATADFLQEYADFLEAHVEAWTVTTQGSLRPDVSRHYIRILPVSMDDLAPDENPDHGMLSIANRPPGSQVEFPANQVVDAGFLELVRYGIRAAGSTLMEDSLRRGRCRAPGRDAAWSGMAPVQPRRLRPARRRRPLRRLGARSRMAAARRRTRTLRARGRPSRCPVPAHPRGICARCRPAARAGLGQRRSARPEPAPRRTDRFGDAPHVGSCRVPQAAALDGRRQGLRPRAGSGGALPATSGGSARDLEAQPPGADGSGR